MGPDFAAEAFEAHAFEHYATGDSQQIAGEILGLIRCKQIEARNARLKFIRNFSDDRSISETVGVAKNQSSNGDFCCQ